MRGLWMIMLWIAEMVVGCGLTTRMVRPRRVTVRFSRPRERLMPWTIISASCEVSSFEPMSTASSTNISSPFALEFVVVPEGEGHRAEAESPHTEREYGGDYGEEPLGPAHSDSFGR